MGIYNCSADTNEDLKYHSSFTEGNELNSICYLEKYNIYIAIHRYNPQPWLPDQNYFVVYDASDFSNMPGFQLQDFQRKCMTKTINRVKDFLFLQMLMKVKSMLWLF